MRPILAAETEYISELDWIEGKVIADVASYGTQSGIFSEASAGACEW